MNLPKSRFTDHGFTDSQEDVCTNQETANNFDKSFVMFSQIASLTFM